MDYSTPSAAALIRAERARIEGGRMLWFHQPDGSSLCLSPSGNTYRVTDTTCTCPDQQFRRDAAACPCKHIRARRNRQ
jgi:hypothetical protein